MKDTVSIRKNVSCGSGFLRVAAFTVAMMSIAPAVSAEEQPVPGAGQGGYASFRLPDGTACYVMKRGAKSGKLHMRLVVDAGSADETEKERGLAHLVEHMEFKGTEHFAANEIPRYMESIGSRSGDGVNAFTWFDHTQYFLNLPRNDEATLSKALLVMSDWAHGPRIDPALLSKEKDVILDEYRRSRNDLYWRQSMALNAAFFPDGAYGQRYPIGDDATLKAITPAMIDDFVRRFYVPGRRALIVVGDVDVAKIKELARALFPATASGAVGNEVPGRTHDLLAPLYGEKAKPGAGREPEFFIDKGLIGTRWSFQGRIDGKVDSARAAERRRFTYFMFSRALRRRFDRMDSWEKQAFSFAEVNLVLETLEGGSGFFTLSFCPFRFQPEPDEVSGTGTTKDSAVKDASGKEVAPPAGNETGSRGALAGLRAFLVELERMKLHGLNEDEYTEGLQAWKDDAESAYKTAGDVPDERVGWKFADLFLGTGFVLTDFRAKEMALEVAEETGLKGVNEAAAVYADVSASPLFVSAKEKGWMTDVDAKRLEEVRGIAKAAAPEAWKAISVRRSLLTMEPTPGKIVKKTAMRGSSSILLELANGIKVYVDAGSDTDATLMIRGYSPGGLSALDPADYFAASRAAGIMVQAGAGSLNKREVDEALKGTSVSAGFSIENYRASMWAKADAGNADDLSTLFQYLYAFFSRTRSDGKLVDAYMYRSREQAKANADNAYHLLAEWGNSVSFGQEHPWAVPDDPETWNMLDPAVFEMAMRDNFQNAPGFTFVITGARDRELVEDLVVRYFGSLGESLAASVGDPRLESVEGPDDRTLKAADSKVAVVCFSMESKPAYDTFAVELCRILRECLVARVRDAVRNGSGGTYHADCMCSLEPAAEGGGATFVLFTCDPARASELREIVRKELARMASGVIDDATFASALEIRRKDLESRMLTNDGRNLIAYEILSRGGDIADASKLEAYLLKVKKADVLKLAKVMLDPAKARTVIIGP